MMLGGCNYAYSVFSPALQQALGFSAGQMALVASALTTGGYLAIFSGGVYDALAPRHHIGPRSVLLVGCVLLFSGYMGLYCCAVHILEPSLPLVLLFAFMAGNAGTWFDTTALATNIRNFPADRGTVIGILKSFLGLSASIYSSIYITTFAPDAVNFLRFLAVVPPLLVLCAGTFINFVPTDLVALDDKLSLHAASVSAASGGLHQPLLLPSHSHADGTSTQPGSSDMGVHHRLHPHAAPESPSPELPGPPRPSHATGSGAVAIKIPTERPQPALHAQQSSQSVRSIAVSRETRFLFVYLIVALFAIYQMASSLYEAQHTIDSLTREVILSGMVVLLALLLLVPVASGECLHPSRRTSQRMRSAVVIARGEERQRTWKATGAAAAAAGSGSGGGDPAAAQSGPSGATPTTSAASAGSLLQSADAWTASAGNGRTASAATLGDDAPTLAAAARRLASGHRSGSSASLSRGASPDPAAVGESSSVLSPRDTWAEVGPPAFHTPEEGGSRSSFCSALSETGVAGSAGNLSVGWRADPGWQGHGSEGEGDEEEESASPPVSLTVLQACRSPIYWLLWLQFFCGVGTGLTLLNNLSALVLALGGKPGGQVVLVSLFSVANATGRLLLGHVSEHMLHRCGTPRTMSLLTNSICMLLVPVACFWASAADLYPLSLLAGLAFGGFWSLIPAITSDLFGLANFGGVYTSLQLAPAAGSYLLASLLASYVYTQASVAHGDLVTCLGPDCFSSTWLVLIAVNMASLGGTTVLVQLADPIYRDLRMAQHAGV
ncbi:MAG: hypothetical protein WDW38_005096 [Sanguina aurantia]